MCAQDSPLLTLPNTLLIHPPPTPRKLGFGWVLPSPSWGPGEGSGLFLQVAEGPSPSPTHQVGLALSCAHLHFQGCSVKETVCNCGGKRTREVCVQRCTQISRLYQQSPRSSACKTLSPLCPELTDLCCSILFFSLCQEVAPASHFHVPLPQQALCPDINVEAAGQRGFLTPLERKIKPHVEW